eukprot:m.4407 g.4407  ORF g.4407 m.4407 type:complete len:143 (-) comp3876_c0_seq1:291-719(-)
MQCNHSNFTVQLQFNFNSYCSVVTVPQYCIMHHPYACLGGRTTLFFPFDIADLPSDFAMKEDSDPFTSDGIARTAFDFFSCFALPVHFATLPRMFASSISSPSEISRATLGETPNFFSFDITPALAVLYTILNFARELSGQQ